MKAEMLPGKPRSAGSARRTRGRRDRPGGTKVPPLALAATSLAGILAGAGLWATGRSGPAGVAWALTTLVALLPLLVVTARDMLGGRFGVDLIALIAMAGALLMGQELAGAVVGLMMSGGQALEQYAAGRARRELAALVSRTPGRVQRYVDAKLVEIGAQEIAPGDRLLNRNGDVVPVDGVVAVGPAVLDESALTGESAPVERREGDPVRSGVVNAAQSFDLIATETVERSTYAGIVRLVQEAQGSKAPFVRLADRYSLVFLPLTLVVAGGAWAYSGDPVRALAVLVVATPCPLILAAPVAIVAGISAAARRGLIVKGGGALESLAAAATLLLDKTGTLTAGTPVVERVTALDRVDPDRLVQLAASLDQVSPHVFSAALVAEARRRHLALTFPTGVSEQPGMGIKGRVGGHDVALGSLGWVTGGPLPADAEEIRRHAADEGVPAVFVAVDGELSGAMLIADPLRSDAAETVAALRAAGLRRVVVLTGDHRHVAERVGRAIGADLVVADCTPAGKVEAVREESRQAVTIMVGDGINDAPALAAAGAGVAMGVRGASASSEAADAVLMVDRLHRLVVGVVAARRATAIARQSVLAGMGLSLLAMAAAAAGKIPPVGGALLQEGIDVLVIVNSLRALGSARGASPPAGDGAVPEVEAPVSAAR